MGKKLFRLMSVACMFSLAGVACSWPSRVDISEKIIQVQNNQDEEPAFSIAGTSDLDSLGKLLFQQYRISLVFPSEHQDDLVKLFGAFTELQLREALEQQLACECVVFGSVWNLVWSEQGFTMVVPRFAESFNAGGLSAEEVAGKFLISGKSESSSLSRRLVQQLSQPRELLRIKFLYVDDSKMYNLGVSDAGPGLTIHLGPGAGLTWSSDMLIDAFVECGALQLSWAAVYSDGVPLNYSHTQEYLLPTYQTNDSGRLLEGTFQKNQAGLTLDLTATNLDGFWRLRGTLEISEFLGGDETATQRRQASIDIDVSPGTAVNLVSVTSDRASISGGFRSNLYGFSSSNTASTFSLWCVVESVQTVEPESTRQACNANSPQTATGPKDVNGALRGG